MDFWNNKVNVSKEAARQQVAIINGFPPEKRFRIALDYANMGVDGTREWIKRKNPFFSELEVTLEFVRLMYYGTGKMTEDHWQFFRKKMESQIQKEKDKIQDIPDNNWII